MVRDNILCGSDTNHRADINVLEDVVKVMHLISTSVLLVHWH